jgi:NMD protein affecting ribosome stability and mRNA decay
MNYQSQRSGFIPIRPDQLLSQVAHDSYKLTGTLSEPSICTDCEAIFHNGYWQWLPAPLHAQRIRCPACNRIRDNFPAGYVSLEGAFFNRHEQEILNFVRYRADREKPWYPQQRIMSVEKREQGTLVTTTDLHLAHSIGQTLHQTYQGELEFHYNPQDNLLRVIWSR